MQRVYSGALLADVAHAQNLLEHEGIASFIKHASLTSALGDLPFLDCEPELWVFRDGEAARARRVLRDAFAPRPANGAPPWTCSRCGEQNEPQFAACWSCGTPAAQG
jgi:putative signal transducing protein